MSRIGPKNIKVAVIGGGAFGEVHLQTLQSMPQVEVAGVFTLDRERGAILAQKYGGTNFSSLADLLADESIRWVTIATPEHLHLDTFEAAAQSGKAIYVEKPLATSLREARAICELAGPLIAMSGHCLRFEARVAHAWASLQSATKYHLSFRDRRTRLEKETYGRVHPAYAMLCHEIELSNAFAGSRFARVLAMETRFSEGQVDGMNLLINYENGVTSSVEGGWYLPTQKGCIEDDFISIVSDQGVHEIRIPHSGYSILTGQGVEFPNLQYGNDVHGVQYGPVRAAFDYMAKCISEDRQPQISTIQDAFNAVELIEAALRSASENRWVSRAEMA